MATFTAVDGAVVEIGGDALPVEQDGASMIGVFRGTLGTQEFTVASARFGQGDGGGVPEGVRLTDEYTLRGGGRLRTGTSTVTDPATRVVVTSVLGVWVGPRFSIHTWLSREDFQGAAAALTSELLGMFSEFALTETETGVVMTPRDTKSFALVRDAGHAPCVVRYIDGVGLVEVFERTPEQAWQIPKQAGARVAGGELWVAARSEGSRGQDFLRDRSDAGALLIFLLANDRAVAHINTDVGAVSEDELLQRCSRLRVDWKPGRTL